MAVVFATATYFPNHNMRLFFIGEVKLKYIAIGFVIIDIMSLTSGNSGGHFSHLGGALFGFLYSFLLKKGYDLGGWFSTLIYAFKKQKNKNQFTDITNSKGYKKRKKKKKKPQTDKKEEKKEKKATKFDAKETDKILDKISQSGYSSLTEEEKTFLFSQSKKLNN